MVAQLKRVAFNRPHGRRVMFHLMSVVLGLGILLTSVVLTAQASGPVIVTVAGDGTAGFSGDGGAATSAQINGANGLFLDSADNLYIADRNNNRIRKVDTFGTITTFAGTGTYAFFGDGGPATSAQFKGPVRIVMDGSGNLYISDSDNQRIRKVDTGGTITTFAGTGTLGYSGDGGAATSAQMYYPYGLAVDSAGNVYIADSSNNRIRKVTTGGIISTFAGTGTGGFSGDSGAATSANLNTPFGIIFDSADNLYIADSSNHRIRKVDTGGTITTVAGTGTGASSGDGGLATAAALNNPFGLAIDSVGNLYIAERNGNRIRKVDTGGIISTFAGTGAGGYSGDGGQQLRLS